MGRGYLPVNRSCYLRGRQQQLTRSFFEIRVARLRARESLDVGCRSTLRLLL